MDNWGREMVILCLQVGIIALTIFCFFKFYYNYKKYYEYLKNNHNHEFFILVKRDSVLDVAGEWVRWPIGSIWLIFSIFQVKQYYNDFFILELKRKSMIFLILTFFFFILSIFFSLSLIS
jgi:hypothetical protein